VPLAAGAKDHHLLSASGSPTRRIWKPPTTNNTLLTILNPQHQPPTEINSHSLCYVSSPQGPNAASKAKRKGTPKKKFVADLGRGAARLRAEEHQKR